MKLELLDISLAPLTSYEFFPGLEKIFDRNDIIMFMTEPLKSPPQRVLPGVLSRIKNVYLAWHKIHVILPQVNRYTLGNKIDKLFLEIIESIAVATFSPREKQSIHLENSSRKLEVLKILLMVLWEIKSIDNKKYILISEPLDEVGKMIGGWLNQMIKQNSPAKAEEK